MRDFKILVTLVTILNCINVCNAIAQTRKVEISAFKTVYIEVPPEFPIISVKEGLERIYFDAEVVNTRLLMIQAQTNKPVPPSNLTILCNGALFQADIIFNHATTKYFYSFTKSDAIIIDRVPTTGPLNEQTQQATPDVNNSVVENNLPASLTVADSKTTKINEEYFERDQFISAMVVGKIEFYVNNMVHQNNRLYISFKIRNGDNIPFFSDFVQWFVTKKERKNVVSTASSRDPLVFKKENEFTYEIKPNEQALYIVSFDVFSLSKDNTLQILIKEGENGRRTIEHEITQKEFTKNVKNIN